MNIEILEPIASKNPTNAYQVAVNVMHGDADAYSTFHLGPYAKDDEFELADLKEVLQALEVVKDANLGSTDRDNYSHLKGFNAKLANDWPQDQLYSQGGDDIIADYADHYVRFFDENGQEFRTKVTL